MHSQSPAAAAGVPVAPVDPRDGTVHFVRTPIERWGPRNPEGANPARAPGSIRRTTMLWLPRPAHDDAIVCVHGTARDLVTSGAGDARVVEQTSLEVCVDPDGLVASVDSDPALDASVLVGAPVGSGFRARLDLALPDLAASGSSLYAMFDDVTVVALIAGYSALRAGQRYGRTHKHRPPKLDICSGWRAGGTPATNFELYEMAPIAEGPEAPDLTAGGDPLAWHPTAELPREAVCRRRRLDVVPTGGALLVDAFFRDSYAEPSGGESVVHEYGLRAEIDADGFVLRALDPSAHVLPFVECPGALASAQDLIGRPVDALRSVVRAELVGTRSCTHLNDMLRSLADIPALVGMLDRVESGTGR